MPDKHAVVTASGSHRWLNCPPSVRLSESMPDETSPAAIEGTRAHELAERKLKAWQTTGKRRKIACDSPEMSEHTDNYRDYIIEVYNEQIGQGAHPEVNIEVQLDLTPWIPEGFGTADACVVSEKQLDIIDFKYGKGVLVEAKDNSQMRLYALGATELLWPIYEFETVRMHIFQPRIDNYQTETLSLDELRVWGEKIKPIARQAYDGEGEQKAGEWCRFCKVRGLCRARTAEMFSVIEEEKEPPLLSTEEIARDLPKLEQAAKWIEDVKAYALAAALEGKQIPGYKVVEGPSARKIKDAQAMAAAMQADGFSEEQIWKPRALRNLTDLERTIGKKTFAADYADLVVKPKGKPTLVPESDKRPEWGSAETMFKEETA